MVYSIMLEGRDEGRSFLITLDVVGPSRTAAKKVALDEAARRGLEIIGVEEVTRKGSHQAPIGSGVLKVYGKAYFDA